MPRASLALCLALAACKPPPEAPTELDELSAYLFRNWESEEEGVLEAGMGNLRTFFDGMDLDLGYNDRTYALDPLTEEDVAGITRPEGSDPADTLPVGLVAGSAFTPTEHTEVIILADQTPVEPNSPDQYERIFLDPENPSCFPDRGCPILRTNNDIIKDNWLMTIPYEMIKDFRWVELTEVGSGDWGILARTWMEEEGVGEEGENTINQSYSIDVFLPASGSWAAYRYMALWSQSTTAIEDEDLIMGATKTGINQIFEATEEWLEENL